ncbi:hypothetical protein VTJ83DRAFT_7323 [Remersonia thermophila]|uniref:4-coumarate--CoA ligase n=1 Tax=Remersonia thermophila TaxID=72144 RepID=A0ABR4D3A5_9PEZI
MPISSRWQVPIPRCSLQQWIFGSANKPLGDSKAFIDPDKPESNYLTMEDYRLLAKRVALGLQREGLKKGDRVLIFSGNNIVFPSVFLGVLMAGGVFTGANPTFVPRELAYQLRDSEASFLLVAEHAVKTALEAAAEAGLPKNRIFVLSTSTSVPVSQLTRALAPGPAAGSNAAAAAGVRHWTELLAGNLTTAETWSWEEPADPTETTCCLNYSSGTTGVPKGVEITHYSYVGNGVGVVHMTSLRKDHEEKLKRDRGLCFLPLYHAYGQTYFIANLPFLRIPVYVMPSFSFPAMLSHISRFRITTLPLVPPIVVLLAKSPLTKQHDLSSVDSIGSGAAPVSREVCEEAERFFPPLPDGSKLVIRQGWGMTEVTCTALGWDPTTDAPPSAGVGELTPNCRAKLMSLEDGGKTEITTPGQRGELWVTGPTLLKRYWRKPEATAETVVVDADGTRWLRTGDVAFVESYDPGAIFHVVDRVKELIKVKGNQVAPAELEGVLLESPDVADAAVVGVTIRDGEKGSDSWEVPRAYVVRRPGSSATEQDVAKWMEGKVAPYKRLVGGVVFVDAIPKNPSGKILRKQLRDRAQAEVGKTSKL